MGSIREELDKAPLMGDIASAVREGRRRNARRAVLIGSTTALVVLAGAFTLSHTVFGPQPAGRSDGIPAVPGPQLSEIVEVGPAVRDWVPDRELVGTPAPAGTALARSCRAADDCAWSFVSADGASIPATGVGPGLARLLADVAAPSDVSLSYDGRWMAVETGGAVRIQSLVPALSAVGPLVVRPSDADHSWDVVGWGSGSLSVALGEHDAGGRSSRYATVDLRGHDVDIRRAPASGRYHPIADLAVGVEVSVTTPKDSLLSDYSTMMVPTNGESGMPVGELAPAHSRLEVGHLLRSGETLAGPGGLPEVGTLPAAEDVVWPQATVFAATDASPRVGVIEMRADGPRRLRIGAEPGWRIVGSNRTGSIIEISSSPRAGLVRERDENGITWSQQLPGDVTWIVPGIIDNSTR